MDRGVLNKSIQQERQQPNKASPLSHLLKREEFQGCAQAQVKSLVKEEQLSNTNLFHIQKVWEREVRIGVTASIFTMPTTRTVEFSKRDGAITEVLVSAKT